MRAGLAVVVAAAGFEQPDFELGVDSVVIVVAAADSAALVALVVLAEPAEPAEPVAVVLAELVAVVARLAVPELALEPFAQVAVVDH